MSRKPPETHGNPSETPSETPAETFSETPEPFQEALQNPLRTPSQHFIKETFWKACGKSGVRRLKRCCEEVNKTCDVEGLCQGYPKRVKLLQQKQGGRLKK